MTTASEHQAVRADAEQRIRELFSRRDRLRRDQDDPMVLSELVSVESEIRAALQTLKH
jgi:hypothetical protein